MYDQIRDCDGKDEMKKRKRNDNRGGEIVCLFLGMLGMRAMLRIEGMRS